MEDDDERSANDVPALPSQLGQKLRTLFADVEMQPIPGRLAKILEALAAKENEPE